MHDYGMNEFNDGELQLDKEDLAKKDAPLTVGQFNEQVAKYDNFVAAFMKYHNAKIKNDLEYQAYNRYRFNDLAAKAYINHKLLIVIVILCILLVVISVTS